MSLAISNAVRTIMGNCTENTEEGPLSQPRVLRFSFGSQNALEPNLKSNVPANLPAIALLLYLVRRTVWLYLKPLAGWNTTSMKALPLLS